MFDYCMVNINIKYSKFKDEEMNEKKCESTKFDWFDDLIIYLWRILILIRQFLSLSLYVLFFFLSSPHICINSSARVLCVSQSLLTHFSLPSWPFRLHFLKIWKHKSLTTTLFVTIFVKLNSVSTHWNQNLCSQEV